MIYLIDLSDLNAKNVESNWKYLNQPQILK